MDDYLFTSLYVFNIFKFRQWMTWKWKNRRAVKEVLERWEERIKGRENLVLAEGVYKLGIQGEQLLE